MLTRDRKSNNADHLGTLRWQIRECHIPPITDEQAADVKRMLRNQADAEDLASMILGARA